MKITLAPRPQPNCSGVLVHARHTLRLAEFLGISRDEELIQDAPLLSRLFGRQVYFLRGWQRYKSCVKGFNALGLLAEHAVISERRLARLGPAALRRRRLEYLAARGVFTTAELFELPAAELKGVDILSLSLWDSFARRRIVCATSSNLGLCLHQALEDLRSRELRVAGRRFKLIGEDEGRLVIWCPDERADFMSPEKSALLKAVSARSSGLTTLKTYLNRRQRDPGALKEALETGGYYFPTNPQSRGELKSLLANALREIGRERGVGLGALMRDKRIRIALESLGACLEEDRVLLGSGVEGGMLGMAAAYMLLMEQIQRRGGEKALSLWNPVSIGAALASYALCDKALRASAGTAGRGLQTRLHGVFDIANLQSLAQLFEVTVSRHLSGRQTAYVGLGSSSYSNGNLCFEILERSALHRGAFRGASHLHPATHALNPLAQALVYGEELLRSEREPKHRPRKPEPAGAAALAGLLLARLDGGALSPEEIAYALRLGGFNAARFLEFSGYGTDEAAERYIEDAAEEGSAMEALARGVLAALEWSWPRLCCAIKPGKTQSRRKYRMRGLDETVFETRDPALVVNLTGDYVPQVAEDLTRRLRKSLKKALSR